MITVMRKVRVYLGDTDSSDYSYLDSDIISAIISALQIVEIDYPQGYIYNVDTDVISPNPDQTTEVLIALQTAIILNGGSVSQSTRQGIYVKDGDTVIDTTKGGSEKGKFTSYLESKYNNLIDRLTMTDSESGGSRIDMYSGEYV